MNKNLLVEYIPFKPIGPINEQTANKFGVPGGLVVQGVLQRGGGTRWSIKTRWRPKRA